MAADARSHTIRVLLAGLRPIVRRIVLDALAGEADIEVIEPDSVRAAAAIAEWCPDVVVVPTAEAAEAYYTATRPHPLVRILEIAEGPLDVYEVRLLAANPGATAVVEAIRAVAARSR
jgi:hypothetical protein